MLEYPLARRFLRVLDIESVALIVRLRQRVQEVCKRAQNTAYYSRHKAFNNLLDRLCDSIASKYSSHISYFEFQNERFPATLESCRRHKTSLRLPLVELPVIITVTKPSVHNV